MPLQRDDFLKSVSREHHHNLLFCWKIRIGIRNGVDFSRLKKYSDWFFRTYVLPHFEIEEKYVFPVLGMDDELVKKGLKQHRRLNRLYKSRKKPERTVSLIEEELSALVRFEERQLFKKIQESATDEEKKMILEAHSSYEAFEENTQDEFWK